MSSGGIRVDTRELDAALDKLARQVVDMPAAHAAVVDALLPGVRQRTPVRTGRLRDSWEAAGEPDRGTISSSEPYAGVVEAINRPIGDTIDASEREIVGAYETEIARLAARDGFEVKR